MGSNTYNGDLIDIPVIDINASNSKAPQELLDAACKHGFIFIANDASDESSISTALIDQQFSLSQQFFALPTHIKQQVSVATSTAGKNHGWLSQGIEKLDPGVQQRPDVKEAFNMGPPNPVDGSYDQPFPAQLVEHLPSIRAFHLECARLCQRILTLVATALDIPPDWFASRHHGAGSDDPHGSVFRWLYYPQRQAEHDDVDIRAGAHSDFGSITCLFQRPGQPGLEIKTADGRWMAVPVDPMGAGGRAASATGAALPILVNIGDLLEDWTGGLLKSTKHRVVFPREEHGDRYSMAYFCHPLDDVLLDPVPSKLVEEYSRTHGGRAATKRNGKPITARDHLMERLAATYNIG